MIRSILINRKRLKAKKRFYAFVLWNSDSGNFGMLSPKFLFEAEWNVQHKSIQTSFLLLIFFSYIPTKRIIAPIYELYSIFVCLSSFFFTSSIVPTLKNAFSGYSSISPSRIALNPRIVSFTGT